MQESDELLRALAGLRSTGPRAEWVQRVREHCHERQARTAREAEPQPRSMGVLDAATLAAFGLYLARVLEQAAHLVAMRTRLG